MTPSNVLASLRTPGIVRRMLVLLAAGFVLLLVVGAASVWSLLRTQDYDRWVEHTQTVIEKTDEAMSLTLEAQSGERGYMITGDPDYLDRYAPAVAVLPRKLQELSELVADNPDQEGRVVALRGAVDKRLVTLRAVVALFRSGQHDTAYALVRSGRGYAQMAVIRDIVFRLESEERRLLAERKRAAQNSARLSLAVNLASLALIALVALVAIVVIRRYVADLQASRAEVDRINQGLEAAVAERTEELVRANEEIQRFAYIVSHDLRAPLVNVMGYTSELQNARQCFETQLAAIEAKAPELIDKDAVTAVREDVPEAIDFIRASTAKMDRLIKAILKLSRDGRRVLAPETIEMTGLVEAHAASLKHQTEEAGAEIIVDRLPPLVSDRLSVEQILGNLLENAVKFLDRERPGVIRVSGEEQGPFVTYRVQDNGRGISANDRERVFELFRRAGAQDRPGEGLGLAFVKNSVRRLGGMIELDSTPGQGSTFTLKFPKALRELPGNAE
jgi:signal transduction histidine kinase